MAKRKKTGTGKQRDLIKLNTIKSYVNDVLDMRISKSAADRTQGSFNALMKAVFREAVTLAKADNRTTIMPQDTNAAIDKVIEKKNLTPADLAKEINKLSAVDLGELVKSIDKIISDRKRSR